MCPDEKSDVRRKGNVIAISKGLLPEEIVRGAFRGDIVHLAKALRTRLANDFPELREKLNTNSRYLGYGLVGRSDALYVYVRRNQLLLDIRVPVEHADQLHSRGFEVKPRNNFQGQSGWLTGLIVPNDFNRLDTIVALASEALAGLTHG